MVAKLEVVKGGRGGAVPPGPGAKRDEAVAVLVRRMGAAGLTRAEVASVLALAATDVEAVYGMDHAAGALEATTHVRLMLYRAATDPRKPNVSAARLFLQAHKDAVRVQARAMKLPGRPVGAKTKVPKPRPKAEPGLGKKAQAEKVAKTAERGTAWDGLL